jgi:uncharacterized oxidoreductase
MNVSGNTILITGGANGIGKALAIRFLEATNTVIVCDRDRQKLEEAKTGTPGLHVLHSDVSLEAERVQLYEAVTREFPKTNVLINNAAIQRHPRIEANEPWAATRKELETNLDAPLHLTQLFIKHLAKQRAPAVVLTTSGLAHVPRSVAPIYCATKAALHSYALSLRHQLAALNVEVIEICPPHVNTDLGGVGRNTAGIDLDTFADAVMVGLSQRNPEITYGFSTKVANATPAEKAELFKQMNPES